MIAIVVNNWVYVVGGEQTIFNNSIWSQTSCGFHTLDHAVAVLAKSFDTVNQTLLIPITESWTNATVNIQSIAHPEGMPRLKYPSLWWDELAQSVFLWAGETSFIYPTAADSESFWAFSSMNTSGHGIWSFRILTSDSGFSTLIRTYGGGSAFSPTSGYYLGGYATAHTTPEFDNFAPSGDATLLLPGLTEFDYENAGWSNHSSAGTGFSGNGWISWPGMIYVPSFGQDGILVVIGGDTGTDQSYGGSASEAKETRSFSNITIYDIQNQAWYSQTASGDVPLSRTRMCITGATSSDNSSYEM